MSQGSNPVVRFFSAIWRTIDASRRVAVNLVFLAIVAGILFLVFRDDAVVIEEDTALVIAPRGVLVEQLTARGFDQILEEATGDAVEETLLKDVVDAIEAATEDDRFPLLVLDLNRFSGGMLTKLQDVAEALDGFRATGRKVIAIADSYNMNQYYLAAHADEIIVHKMGMVAIEGMGRYRMYYKDGLDKFGIDVNVFRVGTFKSAVEPFLRNDMSEAAREANEEWLGDLWQQYLAEAGAARGIGADALERYAQDFLGTLAAADGDTARAALDNDLVDQALTRVEMRDYLVGLVGENEETHSFKRTSMSDYLASLGDDRFGRGALPGDTVAVVVARGTILDGSHPAGTIGGDSTAALIRDARKDENTRAIILRVDSGGGSAFASEVIRRELEAARADGIPVIASMGSVAASGGYWISTSSDQIFAHPSTITGSIGIFAMIPTFQGPLKEYLGVQVDGFTTAPLAGLRPDREIPEDIGAALQLNIEQGYREFLQRVAEARDMSIEDVDAVAQGRVWSGEDAFRLGLVDQLGDLDDAVAAAAELAELGDDYTVRYVEKELDFQQRLLREMGARAVTALGLDSRPPAPLRSVLRDAEAAAGEILRLNDPNQVYAWSTIEND
ncbi:MAG: signal peptide peptidase SppA [Xanthomonadales bacterium]|jgi:protease-4|nr:signal peptide peptidase SppA [Xanthomonadales bacterium]